MERDAQQQLCLQSFSVRIFPESFCVHMSLYFSPRRYFIPSLSPRCHRLVYHRTIISICIDKYFYMKSFRFFFFFFFCRIRRIRRICFSFSLCSFVGFIHIIRLHLVNTISARKIPKRLTFQRVVLMRSKGVAFKLENHERK